MTKKIFFILQPLIQAQLIFSMEIATETEKYNDFLGACRNNNTLLVTKTLFNNPHFKNGQKIFSELRIPHIEAANYQAWEPAFFLLACGADKAARDGRDRSLFSLVIYTQPSSISFLYALYTPEEINNECKTIGRYRDSTNFGVSILPIVQNALEEKSNLEKKDGNGCTALHICCQNKEIPLIVQLLKQGASLDAKNFNNRTPYNIIEEKKSILFATREAFNNGSILPTLLLINAIENVPSDIANIIKQLYFSLLLTTPEARIWQPICIGACNIAGFDNQNEVPCLAHILLLPKEEKTKLNIKCFFKEL